MKQLLFICTGNYYRSRFAEEYFNHIAEKNQLPWRAYSKGLSQNMPSLQNVGPISEHTLKALNEYDISGPGINRFPEPIVENDFEKYHKIIALSELEHKPMIEDRFPPHTKKVEFSEVGDLPIEEPGSAIPKIAGLVDSLIEKISTAPRQ